MDNFVMIFALAAFLALVATVVILVWGLRGQGKAQVEALTALAKAQANNKTWLDAVEPGASKWLGSLFPIFNTGAEFVKSLTPDDIDKLIEAVVLVAKRATDGLPNDFPPEAEKARDNPAVG